jgi:hypothetical protein
MLPSVTLKFVISLEDKGFDGWSCNNLNRCKLLSSCLWLWFLMLYVENTPYPLTLLQRYAISTAQTIRNGLLVYRESKDKCPI